MTDEALLTGFLAALVRVATPLLLAALGEMLAERGGVINLGIEGAMLTGALASAIGSTIGGPWLGAGFAIAAGALVASAMVLISVRAGAEQIITGTALTLAAIGLTAAIYRRVYGPGGAGLSLPTFRAMELPGLAALPIIGPAFFAQSVLTYIAYATVPLLWYVLYRTRWGLELRATGESVDHAHAAGVPVQLRRGQGVLVGGAFAGLAGASLVLAQVGTFVEKMTAGRGFIAIAIVVLGGWRPFRIFGASLFFGGAMALQYIFQSRTTGVPYQAFLMLPYLLTLAVLAGAVARTRAPADLGRA